MICIYEETNNYSPERYFAVNTIRKCNSSFSTTINDALLGIATNDFAPGFDGHGSYSITAVLNNRKSYRLIASSKSLTAFAKEHPELLI